MAHPTSFVIATTSASATRRARHNNSICFPAWSSARRTQLDSQTVRQSITTTPCSLLKCSGRSYASSIEKAYDLPEHLRRLHGVVVIDCLTVWLSNWVLRAEDQAGKQIELLCRALRVAEAEVVAVTNEVGWAIVPDNALARRFRDHSGLMNQRVAEIADRVLLMVCGIPLQVK